jgi:peptidoglycan/LPS O-acetylase OafA/YrhL
MATSFATLPSTETLATSTPNSPRLKSPYQPHLDGLRALAILGVLIEHFGVHLPTMLRYGPLSVRFFFVLTGYFITLSLWKVKSEIARTPETGYLPLGSYYLARMLRIGPPFYLALLVGAVFGIVEVRTNFFWLATFQANNHFAFLGYWPGSIAHFWSLAVQEQFYMLWPIVVLTLPRRWFIPAMAGFILFGLGFRIFCIATATSTITRWVTLFGCIDSFAVGALIAYCKEFKWLQRIAQLRPLILSAIPLAAIASFFLGRALMTLPENNIALALTESVDEIFLAWLLVSSITGVKGRYGSFLSWSPLVYLGRISYGIYVYHVFIIILVSPLLSHYGLTESHASFIRLAILFALTLALASLSWHYLEQPFIAWKSALAERRFSPISDSPAHAFPALTR